MSAGTTLETMQSCPTIMVCFVAVQMSAKSGTLELESACLHSSDLRSKWTKLRDDTICWRWNLIEFNLAKDHVQSVTQVFSQDLSLGFQGCYGLFLVELPVLWGLKVCEPFSLLWLMHNFCFWLIGKVICIVNIVFFFFFFFKDRVLLCITGWH